jgi:hypothetical protein
MRQGKDEKRKEESGRREKEAGIEELQEGETSDCGGNQRAREKDGRRPEGDDKKRRRSQRLRSTSLADLYI